MTQRSQPLKIITGSIKANFSARLAFRVASNIDSRTILNAGGAELLDGRGDMLFGTGTEIMHLQGAFIETAEVERVCEFIGSQSGYPGPLLLPGFDPGPLLFDPDERDPLFEDCARLVVLHQQGSTSLIQRKLKLGYNRAGRIIDQLEAAGVVGPFEGSKAREVLFPHNEALERFLSTFQPVTAPQPEIKPKGFWSRLFNK